MISGKSSIKHTFNICILVWKKDGDIVFGINIVSFDCTQDPLFEDYKLFF